MTSLKNSRIYWIAIVLVILGIFATSSVALAESVDEVEARITAATSSGQIDQATYNDLKAILNETRNATNPSDYNSAVEAYNLLVPGFLSASFEPYGS